MVGEAGLGVIKCSLCRTSRGLGCWKSLCGRQSPAQRPSKPLKFPEFRILGHFFLSLHLQVEVWLHKFGWRKDGEGENKTPGVVLDGRESLIPD